MTRPKPTGSNAESQIKKFREAARELEADQSEEAFDRIVKKIAKAPRSSDTPKGRGIKED